MVYVEGEREEDGEEEGRKRGRGRGRVREGRERYKHYDTKERIINQVLSLA